ncbi:MAG: hypothetical protein ACJA2W_000647 [Planctomycetota bacterium]|jgi:hypothetical protein
MSAEEGSAAADRITRLDSPVSPTGVHPVLDRGRDGVTRLLWTEPWKESGARLFVSRLDGDGFGPARRVVQLEDAFVNWADVPTLSAMADGTLCVTWLEKTSDGTYAYGVRYAVSRDGGVSWSSGAPANGDGSEQASPAWLHTDRSDSEHGFVSTVALGDRFVAIWLDGRATGEGGPQQLWSRSIHPDGSLGTETLVDDSVCDCCSTALMVEADSDLTLLAAWRDRSHEEVRDIHWARLAGETWKPLGPVHADHWVIPGCPVNGPRLERVNETNLCVWTSGEARDGAWAAPLVQGVPQEPMAVNAQPTLGRLGSAPISRGAVLVSWLEQESANRAVWRMRTIAENGPGSISAGEPWTLAATSASRSSGILRLVSLGDQPGDGVLAAWNDGEDGGILVALIHAP